MVTLLKADIIVACTGYDVLQSYGNYKIKGRNGTDVYESLERRRTICL